MISLRRCNLDPVPEARHWMLTFGFEHCGVRFTCGSLDRRWHPNWPDVFILWRGRRVG